MSLEISHDLLNMTDHTESGQQECCDCRLAVDTGASKHTCRLSSHQPLVQCSHLTSLFVVQCQVQAKLLKCVGQESNNK